jgi:hypothetical protein
MTNIGFGDRDFSFAVYIANKPGMYEYQSLSVVMPLVKSEIDAINQSCGNGWRKVFNVYAKLLYALDKEYFTFSTKEPSWQSYRDNDLLQEKSKTALLFSTPVFSIPKLTDSQEKVHIICGKGHAKALIESENLTVNLVWLDEEFAIDRQNKLIVCPYFDYRQLSNLKIERLAGLLKTLIDK